MNTPIRRLTAVSLITLLLLALGATYVQAIAGPRYRDDPRNFRVLLALSGKERGLIVTSDGVTVAESVADAEDPRSYLRLYPHGELYAHAVGFSSLLFGDQGIEAALVDDLRSKRDLTISDLITALLGRDLRARSVQLTLDHRLQLAASDALGAQRGAIVAVDPTTGAVLAFVSHPSFDVNSIVGADGADAYQELNTDPAQPFMNRASRQSYAPGSTFKVITLASAMEGGLVGPTTVFPDPPVLRLPGSTATIRNSDLAACADGETVRLHVAFRLSCNTTFGQLAMDVGGDALADQASAFGFNSQLPIEVGALTSVFPTDLGEDLPAVAQSGIGRRDVQATVLQMAMTAAAVANEGLMMKPHLVARIIDADGSVVSETQPEIMRRAISPGTALLLSDLMEEVVTLGTGKRGQVPGVRVAGKTGTSATESGPRDVWFIALAPVEDPTIAIAVLVEEAGESASGGSVAAPIASEVLKSWFEGNN